MVNFHAEKIETRSFHGTRRSIIEMHMALVLLKLHRFTDDCKNAQENLKIFLRIYTMDFVLQGRLFQVGKFCSFKIESRTKHCRMLQQHVYKTTNYILLK